METVVYFFLLVIISALIALIGKDRKIGFGWGFVLCLLVSPVIGFFIIRRSKKKVEFLDNQNNK